MIQAVIFDMDGLLIDSEPLWKDAEIDVFNGLGVPLSEEMTNETMGLRVDEVVKHWHQKYPWAGHSLEDVAYTIDQKVLELIKERGVAQPGVNKVMTICRSAGLKMAVASSSSMEMIMAVMEKLGLKEEIKVVCSAHTEAFGKPHPAVYLSTAKELGVEASRCLAFEDSANGVLSAKAAKMKCIAVPERDGILDKRFGIADLVIGSLNDFNLEMIKDW